MMTKISRIIEKGFPFLMIAAVIIGCFKTNFTSSLTQAVLPNIKIFLGLIMFSMGLTIQFVDFKILLQKPKAVLIGVIAQYTIMPLAAFTLAMLLQLPPEFAVGLILVGCCPGGTASNVIVYLARGDLALSVAMTSISTLLAPIAIPILTLLLAKQWTEVNTMALFTSALQVVLMPVMLGMFFKFLFLELSRKIANIIPILAIGFIFVVLIALINVNIDKLMNFSLLVQVFIAVILHNALGLSLGYITSKFVGLSEEQRRAISIEVGMQNSGLGAVLAITHFGPLASMPSIMFSFWHNFTGSILVSFWTRNKN